MDKGLLNIGLLLEPIDMEKYDFIRFNIKENWVVLMPPDDPLSKKDFITAQDLSGALIYKMSLQTGLANITKA